MESIPGDKEVTTSRKVPTGPLVKMTPPLPNLRGVYMKALIGNVSRLLK
jgi:hypothetical protein